MNSSNGELRAALRARVLDVTAESFAELAIDIFRFQYNTNVLYRQYCELIGRYLRDIQRLEDIPFLPIQCFKHHDIRSGLGPTQKIFRSSGTTGQSPSRHLVADLALYDLISSVGFEHVFEAKVSELRWYALLPSYLERNDASLVHMVSGFIQQGGGAFYLNDLDALARELIECNTRKIPHVLIGVSFALIDFAASSDRKYPGTVVVETGGMKGRRREMLRKELHAVVGRGLGTAVYSEYGMTELLSQAWMRKECFVPAPTMRVFTREISDPLDVRDANQRGALNIIDLANLDSCSFVATEDVGRVYANGTFEVLGRLDGSEQRGCNLMYTEII